MKQYIGTKIIQAEPAAKAGHEGYFVTYPDGYASWSPKGVFEEAYRETDALPFSLALEAMKKGMTVRRKAWIKEGRSLTLDTREGLAFPAFKDVREQEVYYWLPRHVDLLADDWEILA